MDRSRIAQRLLDSTSVNLLALVVNIAAALILMPVLIDRLGDAWYGSWVLIGSIIGYTTILDLGMFAATQRFIAIHHGRGEWRDVNVVVNTCLVLFGLAGLAGLALMLAAAAAVPWVVSDPAAVTPIRIALIIAAVDIALFFPGGLFNGIMVAQVRYDLAALLDTTKVLVRTGLILLIVDGGPGIVALAAITLATNTAERLARAWICWRLFPQLRLSLGLFDRRRIGAYLRYGLNSAVTEISEKIRFNLDVVIVGAILGAASVTVYNIAARLVSYLMQFVIRGLGFMMPVFAHEVGREDWPALRRDFLFVSKLSAVFAVIAGGGLAFIGRPFIALWIGPDYGHAVVPLAILIVGVTVEMAQMQSALLLMALNRIGFLARLGVAEAAANIALSLALAAPFGLAGVALGTTLPLLAARLGVQPAYVCRQIDLSLAGYARAAGGAALLAAAVQLPMWAVRDWLLALPAWQAAPIVGLAYAAIAALALQLALDREQRSRFWNNVAVWARRGH
jgi:O-antigen/teichoic acid export membrane protein